MRTNCLQSIKSGWQFRKLLRHGYRFTGKVLRARYHKNTLGRVRLGFSVSAKTGNAVQRNLFKRRLRQYSVEVVVEKGFDAVIFPTIPLKYINWKMIKVDMEKLVKHTEKNRK
ncbi:MAG: ribonuclease P protein component [Candidatus Fermentibacteria bacterium]|nr:ribonuclease P protein component [Candidatus Fermentibacteria bacterium]